jgi:PadR family transcriptional regulator PadR
LGKRGRARHGRRQACSALWVLEPALLLLLHHGPAHGYVLQKQLKRYSLENPDRSVVYRALRDMQEKRWVTSTWDEEQTRGPPRRVYRLTALGDEVLARHTQDLQRARGMIDRLLVAYRRHMQDGEGDYH